MESVKIPNTDISVSRIALGTWAIGGWMWGGTDEAESVRTIRAALDKGIDLIDTAPVYGFGRPRRSWAGRLRSTAGAINWPSPPRWPWSGKTARSFAIPLHICQPPYNLFERGIEENGIKDFCAKK